VIFFFTKQPKKTTHIIFIYILFSKPNKNSIKQMEKFKINMKEKLYEIFVFNECTIYTQICEKISIT